MKLVLAGLLVAFSQAAGEPNAPVALFVRFEQPPGAEVDAALRSELDSIMEPAGVRFQWRALPKHAGQEVHRELVVVKFKGSCRVHEDIPRASGAGALGWTHTSGSVLLPFVDVECDRVLGLLHDEMKHIDPEDRDEVLGRALGRVLSHELYHVLGRTRKHGSAGVAKPAYSPAELTADEFFLEEGDLDRIRGNRPEAGSEAGDSGH